MHDIAKAGLAANPFSWENSTEANAPGKFVRTAGEPYVFGAKENEETTKTLAEQCVPEVWGTQETLNELLNDAARPDFDRIATKFRPGVDFDKTETLYFQA